MVLGGVLRTLLAGMDVSDALLLVGLGSFIGGIAALNRPAAAIVFGAFVLVNWYLKAWRRKGRA